MAIYATFFLAEPQEVLGGFPGWKPPLPAPVRRERRNPFTQQLVTIETREPDWQDVERASEVRQHRVVAGQGRYGDYLENRLPPFIRRRPHWAAKGLTDAEIDPSLHTLGITTRLECPIYAPPSAGAVLREFPPESVSKLVASDRREVAQRWAAAMSTPEHTQSASGNRLNDGWTTDDAAQILTPLILLAGGAVPGQKLYLLIEA